MTEDTYESGPPSNYFDGPEHALRSGMVWGLFLKSGLTAFPEMDDDLNYTDIIRITHDDMEFRVRVLP